MKKKSNRKHIEVIYTLYIICMRKMYGELNGKKNNTQQKNYNNNNSENMEKMYEK